MFANGKIEFTEDQIVVCSQLEGSLTDIVRSGKVKLEGGVEIMENTIVELFADSPEWKELL